MRGLNTLHKNWLLTVQIIPCCFNRSRRSSRAPSPLRLSRNVGLSLRRRRRPVARAYAVGCALRSTARPERGGRALRPWSDAGRASRQRPARARYVAKYLVKSGQQPAFTRGRCRRFAMRARRAPRAESDWRYDSRRPALVAVEELGCREIDWAAEGWCAYEPRKAGRSAPAG